jgi:hypothetical protein
MGMLVEPAAFSRAPRPAALSVTRDLRIFPSTVLTNALEKLWEFLMKKAYNPNKITIPASNPLPSPNG